MPTIYNVAKKAGVSIATVSAVLNRTAYVSPELTKRVKEAVAEMDYTINHLAHSLQTRTTRTIGMLIPDAGNPDPFYGQVVRGAEDVLRKKGYLLILGHTYNQVEEQSRYSRHSAPGWWTACCCSRFQAKTASYSGCWRRSGRWYSWAGFRPG